MCEENMLNRVNKVVIMIILGTFTIAELLYIAPEYKWGLEQVYVLVATVFK